MKYLFFICITFQLFAQQKVNTNDKNTKVAYFASGCFWCVEAIYESVPGVVEAVSGYAGAHAKNPTYSTIKKTGHAETVAVYYNPKKVSYQDLLEVYYSSQNPTTYGQKPDFGHNYRSIIFYNNTQEKNWAWDKFKEINKIYKGKAVTSIEAINTFYPAEKYHQNFEKRHPNHPYIMGVSIPRLNRFKAQYFN